MAEKGGRMVLSPFLVGFFTSSVAAVCESYIGAASLGTQSCCHRDRSLD